MNMNWNDFPLWKIHETEYDGGSCYSIKVAKTSGRTIIGESCKDYNVQLDKHYADNDRLIGYTLSYKNRIFVDSYPKIKLADSEFWVNLVYNPILDKGKMSVVYYDANVRLLAFGDKPRRLNYLLTVRYRSPDSFIWNQIEESDQENED